MGQLYSHLVFRPPAPTYESYEGRMLYVTPDKKGVPHVYSSAIIWLQNELGARIPAAWVRKPKSNFVILFAHANGDDLGKAMSEAQRISDALDLSVLAFDYTGYGISEMPKKPCRKDRLNKGTLEKCPDYPVVPSLSEEDRNRAVPSEYACYADIHCAYNYLVEDCGIEPSNIILVGRSIGSGPVVHCAASYPVGGVVLVAPIASAVRVALKRCNITLPLIDTFTNIDKVERIKCPVLVIHGDHDELVPKRHAELLVEKVRKFGHAVEPLWIPTAMHNNVVEDHQSLVFGRYRNFIKEVQTRAEMTPLQRISSTRDFGVSHLIRTLISIPHRALGVKHANNTESICQGDPSKACDPSKVCDPSKACGTIPSKTSPYETQRSFETEPVSGDLSGHTGCLGRRRRRTTNASKPEMSRRSKLSFSKIDILLPELNSFSTAAVQEEDYLSYMSSSPETSRESIDDTFRRAIMESRAESVEFVSYPVDYNDRISLSIKEGISKMISDKAKQPRQEAYPKKCELPPLTDSILHALHAEKV